MKWQPCIVRIGWVMALAVGLGAIPSAEVISVQGITEPFLDVTLSPSGPGIIRAHLCEEGDFVEKGQVVIEQLKKLEELEVERRKIALETSKIDYESTRQLYEKTRSVSRDELMNKESTFKVAQADYGIAQEQLRQRQIVSPLSGSVVQIIREVGEAAQAHEPLIRIVDTRKCYLICNIEARSGYRIRSDQPVRLEIEAGNTPVLVNGVISFISPVVDPASGLLKVKALFDNPNGKIRPGVTGTMSFTDTGDAG